MDELTISLDGTDEEFDADADVIFSLMAFEESFDVIETLLKAGFTPAQVLDYLAITVAGKDMRHWAEVRDMRPKSLQKKVEEIDVGVEAIETHGENTRMTRNAVACKRDS